MSNRPPQMRELAGYWIASARQVAQHLNIDIGEDTEFNNVHIEWPINNWLYANAKLHIKSAFLKWPQGGGGEDGVFFMTQHRQYLPGDPPMKENEKDLEVKRWLEECGAGGAQWVSLPEGRHRITLMGVQPRHSDLKFKQASTEEMDEILREGGRRFRAMLRDNPDF